MNSVVAELKVEELLGWRLLEEEDKKGEWGWLEVEDKMGAYWR